jgi:hypothetical protein
MNDIERQSARHRETPAGTEPSVLQRPPQLASDNVSSSTTHERLQRLVGKGHHSHQSLTVLASLLEECAAAWHDSSAFDKLAEGAEKDFFLFEEDQVRAWVDSQYFSYFPVLSSSGSAHAPARSVCRYPPKRKNIAHFCPSGSTRALGGISSTSSPRPSLGGHVLYCGPQCSVIR